MSQKENDIQGGTGALNRRQVIKYSLALLGGILFFRQGTGRKIAVRALFEADRHLNIRPERKNFQVTLASGIDYVREIADDPRPIIAHVVTVDLTDPSVSFFVTPGDSRLEKDTRAYTTSDFLQKYHQYGFSVAINANFFRPFDPNLFNPRPRTGDQVDIRGLAISNNHMYSKHEENYPVLCLIPETVYTAAIQTYDCPLGTESAVSGNRLLVSMGQKIVHQDSSIHPRTGVGITGDGRRLLIIVVDGRQELYSEGVSLNELADIFIQHQAAYALNLDGGGSSTLAVVVEGQIELLNSPIHQRIWGSERPVGNALIVNSVQ